MNTASTTIVRTPCAASAPTQVRSAALGGSVADRPEPRERERADPGSRGRTDERRDRPDRREQRDEQRAAYEEDLLERGLEREGSRAQTGRCDQRQQRADGRPDGWQQGPRRGGRHGERDGWSSRDPEHRAGDEQGGVRDRAWQEDVRAAVEIDLPAGERRSGGDRDRVRGSHTARRRVAAALVTDDQDQGERRHPERQARDHPPPEQRSHVRRPRQRCVASDSRAICCARHGPQPTPGTCEGRVPPGPPAHVSADGTS